MSIRRKPPKFLAALSLAFTGLAVLLNVASKPEFATFRKVDVVRLVASGMCFGAAISMFVMYVRGRRSE